MNRTVEYLATGPSTSPYTVVLAHGAGVGMAAPFMQSIADGLAAGGIRTVRFNFPYMQVMRMGGGRRPPDRPEVLLGCYRHVIGETGDPARLVIGGKSLGGRMASMIADEAGVAGLVCLGYPFHPPGKPENLRTGHLASLGTPALIIQGERDPFGTRAEVETYQLPPSIEVAYMPDGDHSFRPRKASGVTEHDNLTAATEHILDFVRRLHQ